MKLRDLQAPPWAVTVGERRFTMRPLSLATFAEAELYGLTLARLSDADSSTAWVELFAFLHGIDPTDTIRIEEELLPELLTDPLGYEAFRVRVAESFSGEESTPQPSSPKSSEKKPRRVQKYKAPEEQVKESQLVDYGFLIDISRSVGISVHDLMRMTFYGVTSASQSLERLPPVPGLGGLFG